MTLHTAVVPTTLHHQRAVIAVLLQAVHQAVLQAVVVAVASEVHAAVAAVTSEEEDDFEIKRLRN